MDEREQKTTFVFSTWQCWPHVSMFTPCATELVFYFMPAALCYCSRDVTLCLHCVEKWVKTFALKKINDCQNMANVTRSTWDLRQFFGLQTNCRKNFHRLVSWSTHISANTLREGERKRTKERNDYSNGMSYSQQISKNHEETTNLKGKRTKPVLGGCMRKFLGIQRVECSNESLTLKRKRLLGHPIVQVFQWQQIWFPQTSYDGRR